MDQPPPIYISWEDYLARTSRSERMRRCYAASKKANRRGCWLRRKVKGRSLIAKITIQIQKDAANNPCGCCGSLYGQECLGAPSILTGEIIWSVIESAKGRCHYCGSLAVESRPSHPSKGSPLRWASVGRRIGSLEHLVPYSDYRINRADNLAWACLWCNVHPEARNPGATDHGGCYPD
jgi:hypothetical protein